MEKEILAVINYIYYKARSKRRNNLSETKEIKINIGYLERRYKFLKEVIRWKIITLN